VALAILLLLALAVRTIRALQEPVVNPDTIRFIDQAQLLPVHPLEAVRAEVYHPLHSAAGLFVHGIIGRFFSDDREAWLASMQAVGVVCGAIVALQIVRLSRLLGAPFWAGIGAGFVWTIGRRTSAFGADGLSDMLFLVLFTAAMTIAITAMRGLARPLRARHNIRFALAGVFSGLAYLTRPEGLGAALILGITIVLLALPRPRSLVHPAGGRLFKLFPRRRAPGPAAAVALLLLLVGTAIPALPYMLAIGTLTHKVPAAGAAAPAAAAMLPLAAFNPGRIVMELWETFGFAPWLVLLLALPLRMRLWGRPRLRLVVIVWMVVWTTLMAWVLARKGYLDGRHTLALQVALHAVLALAFAVWVGGMRCTVFRWRLRPDAAPWMRWGGWIGVAMMLVVLLAALPGLIRFRTPPLNDQYYIAEAAGWIRYNIRPDVLVCDTEMRIGYYSGHPYALWQGPEFDPRLEELAGLRGAPPGRPGRPLVAGWIFRPGIGQLPLSAIGPYREIMRFHSDLAAHGDVLVLYALPEDHVLRAPAVQAATGIAAPTAPAARPQPPEGHR
jgi:hypothetical protein